MALPASADLGAASLTTIYTVPALTKASFNVSFINRNASDTAKVRLALTTGAAPTVADYIEWDAVLSPGMPLERFPLTLMAGGKVWARADIAGVSCVAFGEEE